MGLFSTKCGECKTKENVQMCPYCKKDTCTKCQSHIILNKKTPEWFVGKKVKTFTEYKNLYIEYCNLIRSKGSNVHCCDSYLNEAWTAIERQVKKFTKDTTLKTGYITLK